MKKNLLDNNPTSQWKYNLTSCFVNSRGKQTTSKHVNKKSIAHAKPFMHNSIVESLMFYHRYQKSHVQWRVIKKIYWSSYQIAWIKIMEQPSHYDMKYYYELQLILRNYCSFFYTCIKLPMSVYIRCPELDSE